MTATFLLHRTGSTAHTVISNRSPSKSTLECRGLAMTNNVTLLPIVASIPTASGRLCYEMVILKKGKANMLFLLGLQVPQECPQAVSDMVFACLNADPDKRPSAQQIIHVIEASIAGTQQQSK